MYKDKIIYKQSSDQIKQSWTDKIKFKILLTKLFLAKYKPFNGIFRVDVLLADALWPSNKILEDPELIVKKAPLLFRLQRTIRNIKNIISYNLYRVQLYLVQYKLFKRVISASPHAFNDGWSRQDSLENEWADKHIEMGKEVGEIGTSLDKETEKVGE